MEILKLAFLSLKMTFLRLMQQLLILPLYLKYPLLRVDLEYLKAYGVKNPYRICRKYFFEHENKEVFYGETWPFSVAYFKAALKLTNQDVLYDLGSGTSRISFWFQILSGCRVKAIEKVPQFIEIAKRVQKKIKNFNVELIEKDLLDVDYSQATAIYFYSSNIEDQTLLGLIEKWNDLKKGVKIITTSFKLEDYGAKGYEIIGAYRVSYPWGKCDVYIQQKSGGSV